ncbi:SDR family NAD(P)-dependent oxidoreductase [Kribbella sp. NPDC049227]|uniref:SDR family NAD(P)-dependent oxidoreductase n=1 Tax=Kribbella sp. NPDC049227 TaxID=3364113 RepID=UPI00371210B1
MNDLSGNSTIVVGASRGLGRGIATAFAEAGGPVVVVSRTAVEAEGIEAVLADAGDATLPARLYDRYEPKTIVLVAGATPHMRRLQDQTWETFSVNWDTDVRIAFHWLREALLTPLAPGSKVIVMSSGAALNKNGSPLSGGYAGAKATQRLIAAYAQDESERNGLGIAFTTIMSRFAPQTGVGRPAVQAYAARAGQSVDDYLAPLGPLLTPEIAGTALVDLVRRDRIAPTYMLDGSGLEEI